MIAGDGAFGGVGRTVGVGGDSRVETDSGVPAGTDPLGAGVGYIAASEVDAGVKPASGDTLVTASPATIGPPTGVTAASGVIGGGMTVA